MIIIRKVGMSFAFRGKSCVKSLIDVNCLPAVYKASKK